MSIQDQEPLHYLVDRAIRDALRQPDNLREFLNQVVPNLVPGFNFQQMKILEPTHFMDDWRSRESDLLVEIPYRKDDQETWALICLLLEHQSYSDQRVPLRMLLYSTLYWDRRWKEWESKPKPKEKFQITPILRIVMYTDSSPWGSNRTLADLLGPPSEFHDFAPKFEPIFWELAHHTPDALMNTHEAFSQFLAVLRLHQAEKEIFEPIYRKAVEELEAFRAPCPVRWYDLLKLILTLVTWRRDRSERKEWWEMTNTLVEDQTRWQRLREMQKEIAEEFRKEGREEGLEEGLQLGQQEGIRKIILRQGRIRFGEPSEEIRTKIQAIDVLEQLETLSERLLQVNSWEELLSEE
jgi:hypothetical protein